MNNEEEQHQLIVECPHCNIRVIPKADNTCPNCQENVSDLTGVDPNRVALTVSEQEEFPSYCYSCNNYTDRFVRVSPDGESGIERLLFGDRLPEETSNIVVHLPACELCIEKDVELVEADYDHQTLTIMVHRAFRERVLQSRENPPPPSDEKFDDNM